MKKSLIGFCLFGALFASGMSQAYAEAAAAPTGDYIFVAGNATQLNGVKRVIITNFTTAFQLDGSMRKDNATRFGNLTLFGGNSKEAVATMEWGDPNPALLQSITDAGLAALKADFKAKGIEVLDESALANQPAYAKIIAATGLTNLNDYKVLNISDDLQQIDLMDDTRNGMVKIVSASGLKPYNISSWEGGMCCYVHSSSYPSREMYYVPGYEIDLALALDAVVVKAWQFVNFTQLSADVNREGWAGGVGGSTVTYSAEAKTAVRLREEKTRLSFRLPTSTDRARNTPKITKPQDGDVVVTLAKPMLIGTQHYSIEDSGAKSGQWIGEALGKKKFNFSATLSDPITYKSEVSKAINQTLGGLVTTALGR